MNRKEFLRASALLGIGMSWGGAHAQSLLSARKSKRLVVLHTNDMHSHIEPFPDDDPKYPGQGGMAKRAALIKQIRAEGHPVLLVDAGDVFQGTPYFNLFKGALEFKLMSQMGYDAATLGNHDFDNGVQGLATMLPLAKFPFVNSNYALENTPIHKEIKPHLILKKGGLKVGIYGLGVDLNGLVSSALTGEVRYLDPVVSANRTARFLRHEAGCDLVLCLSHLGFDYKTKKISDLSISASLNDTDIILGGHTHTFLHKPVLTKDATGRPLVIGQTGWAGIHLGRIDFFFSPENQILGTKTSMYEISKKTIPG